MTYLGQFYDVFSCQIKILLFFSIFPTIPAANNLALVLKLQGELNESKELFEMAFAIAESALGNRHVWTAAVAGNLGDSDHLLQYTVLGDTVNQASRLTGLTPPGAVYVNQRNAEMIDPNHDPIALDPVKVKGRARKVQPHQIWPRMEFTDVT